MSAIDFNQVFLTNPALRKQVAETLRDWGLGEKPERPELGVCFNLKLLYPDYRFDQFVRYQSLDWPHHKTKGKTLTSFPIRDIGFNGRKWQNPERLDLCRYLAKLLELS